MHNDAQAQTNTELDLSGLDFDFLRYMGVKPEAQRAIQEFYLPRFAGCANVVDLGCGDGDFVKLLVDRGIRATGVDSDDKAQAAAESHGLPFVQDDVFHYLRTLAPESADGIFCAHLVEHLPYEKVIELVQLSFDAISPGGVIVLATPDVRTLFSHLEMFYLHFGHISFYHPRLLCFFLDHAGFVRAEYGTNPRTPSPLLAGLKQFTAAHPGEPPKGRNQSEVAYRREIPPQGNSLLHRASYSVKRRLTRWLVQPFLDDLTRSINQEMKRNRDDLDADLHTIAASIQTLNGPFECYAVAYKPPAPSSDPAISQSPA